MSVGIVRVEKVVSARAGQAGQKVYTSVHPRDQMGLAGRLSPPKPWKGIARENLPAIQVGDPFRQKVLLEALLEMIEAGLIAGMQDMGPQSARQHHRRNRRPRPKRHAHPTWMRPLRGP